MFFRAICVAVWEYLSYLAVGKIWNTAKKIIDVST